MDDLSISHEEYLDLFLKKEHRMEDFTNDIKVNSYIVLVNNTDINLSDVLKVSEVLGKTFKVDVVPVRTNFKKFKDLCRKDVNLHGKHGTLLKSNFETCNIGQVIIFSDYINSFCTVSRVSFIGKYTIDVEF